MARLISPELTKNVSELRIAVVWWELTPVEHESKVHRARARLRETAAMRAMLPRDMLERFFDGPLNHEELRIRVSAHVEETLAGRGTNTGAQSMDI